MLQIDGNTVYYYFMIGNKFYCYNSSTGHYHISQYYNFDYLEFFSKKLGCVCRKAELVRILFE